MRIEPQLLRVRASQRTSVGLAIHANTITITPGTISLDVRDGTILVHALTEAGASQDGSGDIDRKICLGGGARVTSVMAFAAAAILFTMVLALFRAARGALPPTTASWR
jgi:hypothetical protein